MLQVGYRFFGAGIIIVVDIYFYCTYQALF